MAAAQPFISGAISKTINLPNEATVEEIKECYHLSWTLGLKANALYRDGCKLSQPLSNKSETAEEDKAETASATTDSAAAPKVASVGELTPEMVLEAAKRIVSARTDTKLKRHLSNSGEQKRLPNRRNCVTQKGRVGGQTYFVRTGAQEYGTVGALLIPTQKNGG